MSRNERQSRAAATALPPGTTKLVTIPFKGGRDYIQGADLFNLLIGYPRAEEAPLTGIRFVVNRPLTSGEIEIVCGVKDASWPARLDASLDGREVTFQARTAEASHRPEQRVTYDERPVRSRCHVDGTHLTYDGPSGYNFIETLVSCNKLLLETLHSREAGRWLFVRLDLTRDVTDFRHLELDCVSTSGSRLYRSKIGDGIGDIYFMNVK